MAIPFHHVITETGKHNPFSSEPETDVCLLLEGTYPYVSGGVSSWVHDLIGGLPDLKFSLYVILPDNEKRKLKYELPANVTCVYLHPLSQPNYLKKPKLRSSVQSAHLTKIVDLHHHFSKIAGMESAIAGLPIDFLPTFLQEITPPDQKDSEQLVSKLEELFTLFSQQNMEIPDRIQSRKTWNIIDSLYRQNNLDCSFVDYFWTWRFLHMGIFSIMNAFIPKAGIYHAVSTGYAGFIGARAQLMTNTPLILTEHGIYNKERKIDISRSPWIYEERRHYFRAQRNLEVFKELWIKAFTVMARICYQVSSSIITLYSGNQRYQLQDGARPEIMQIIPNGIDFDKLSILKRLPQPNKIIGFVGRIVTIKDVKTFIRAVSIVFKSYPDSEAWLMGPTDENQQYYEECQQLVEFLEIGNKVKFTGMVDLKDYYPKLDIVVLTSISEAQPLVILEAFSLGIPVVATDVGACKELIEGSAGEDAKLGKAGLVTGMANPAETALSILHLLRNPGDAEKMGSAGKERVKRYYDLPKLFERYRQLYKGYLES